MRYLVKHTKEFVIAICVFICVITISVLAIMSGDYLKVAGALVNDVATLLGLYFNMPTSKENSEATVEMRLLKKKEDLPIDYFESEDDFAEEECGDVDG